ncbi:hypothetical protein E2C01_066059 [Portunus trituberculatus]|uniref:Uncharacterized protein n=1 Tax=Portunus trituberculatus TaxID=210409 RepID=A0A5B7HNS3_PORTR|nr:hypothetical protein [Portunus trituberculatus]
MEEEPLQPSEVQ